MRITNLAFVHAALLLFVPAVLSDTPTFDSLVKLVESGETNELRSVLKAYPNAVHIRNENRFPLIHRAAMTDQHQAIAVLLDAGAKVNSRDTNFGRTPLHIAAGWSTLAMVQLLWSRGADPKATTEKGATVLDFAMDNFYKDGDVERDKILAFLRGRGSKMSEGEKRRQAVIEEVERDLASRPNRGAEPKQSDWDASVDIVKQYVISKTQDPSAKFDEWSKVTALGDKWAVRAKFQYKNAAGVLRQDNRWFYIRDGAVIGTKPAQ
jgi:hypothetical protein